MSEVATDEAVGLESLVARVADEFRQRQARGERPDPEEYAIRHPEAAPLLRKVLAALDVLGLSLPTSEAGALAPGGEPTGTLGDFRLIREVGRGGMGVVYEAEQISLARRVALKVLPFAATMDPRHLQRFQNEARAAAGLHHTNIVPVYAVGCERGVHFYAMQFIEGQTVAQLIADQESRDRQGAERGAETVAYGGAAKPLPDGRGSTVVAVGATQAAPRDAAYYRRAADWGIQAAEALDHAHQLGIVHRDVKPANLLIDGHGQLWVADFGLARTAADSGLTMTGDLVGTLRYMSPEQALAKRVVIDHRTDVYSLGATLYELLTLQPAFSGSDRQELLRQIAFEEPKPPRRVNKAIPAELETIVLKAMEKNPAERYATAKELTEDLRRFMEDRPIRARRPSPLQQARKWAARHRAPVRAAALVLVLAVTMLAGTVGYVASDQAARRRATQQVVTQALDESASWQEKRRLPEALSAARRAAGLVAGGEADEAMRRRVQARVDDLELLARLDEARLQAPLLSIDNRSEPRYGEMFRDANLDVEGLPVEQVIARLRGSSVAVEAAAVLDSWALCRRAARLADDASWKHLLRLARAVDPHGWRARLREALEGWDRDALVALASSDQAVDLLPPSQEALATALLLLQANDEVERLLRNAQGLHPDDFWINELLGAALLVSTPPRPGEAVPFFMVAIALRRECGAAYCNLGDAQRANGNPGKAITAYHKATDIDPTDARAPHSLSTAYSDLGTILLAKGDVDGAIAAYRYALEFGHTSNLGHGASENHNYLGNALRAHGDADSAIAEYRRAIALWPNYPILRSNLAGYQCNLGLALTDKGDLDGAIAAFQEAIRLNKDFAEAHCNLGGVLDAKGQFTAALAEYRLGHELGRRLGHDFVGKPWAYPSAEWVRNCERLVDLDGKLPAVVRGQRMIANTDERLALAQLCQLPCKSLYVVAVRFYNDAFAEQPKLADDLQGQPRYNAACAAALAGCGQGKDAKELPDKERLGLRHQALAWLRADMAAYRALLDKEPDKVGPTIRERMQHWRQDTDFAGVRGPEALARLPAAEHDSWQKLWTEVEELRQRAAGQAGSQEKPGAR